MNNHLTVKPFATSTIITRKKIKIRFPKKHLNRKISGVGAESTLIPLK